MNRQEARLEHFKAVREKRKKTLHWWKYQKPYKQYDLQTIQETCAEHGAAISYLDDVIEMLEKVGVEND
jgi:alpha-D-ribose 1-methylphosphonate 5-phosphate C-P lyase